MLPHLPDHSPPPGPSGAMGPLRIPPLRKGPLLAPPHIQDQAAQQAAPQGALVPLLEQSFTHLTGLKMGILMPLSVGPSLPSQGGWAAQPAVQAVQGMDADSVPGSAGELRWQASLISDPVRILLTTHLVASAVI